MRALAFKARVLFATRFAEMAEYRAEVVIWMLSGTLSLVMMLVWMAQAAAAPGGQIRGYSAPEFATYFLSTWLVSQLLVVWVSHELDFQIRQGTLSPQLLRPVDPMWLHVASHVAERLVRIVPLLALVGVFTWLSGASFTREWWAYPAALGLAALGFSVRFLYEYAIGLLAFWTESSASFQEVVWLVYAALGGMFAPLAFYPEWVQRVAVWTPFPYMLGLPRNSWPGRPPSRRPGAARWSCSCGSRCSGSSACSSGASASANTARWAHEGDVEVRTLMVDGGSLSDLLLPFRGEAGRGGLPSTINHHPSPRPEGRMRRYLRLVRIFVGRPCRRSWSTGRISWVRCWRVWVRWGWRCWASASCSGSRA